MPHLLANVQYGLLRGGFMQPGLHFDLTPGCLPVCKRNVIIRLQAERQPETQKEAPYMSNPTLESTIHEILDLKRMREEVDA